MPSKNLKYYVVLILTILVLSVLLLREYSEKASAPMPRSAKEDISFKQLPPAPVLKAEKEIVKVKVYIPKIVKDTSEISRLLAERDSLAKVLTTQNVTLSYSTDTIHPTTHDTLRIECDDLKKHISYSLNYAPRMEKTVVRTETYISELTIWDKLYYSVLGAGFIEVVHLIFGR